MIRLVTVGTGTVAPHAHRASPAHWVEAGAVRLLMDCGPGTCSRLARCELPWPQLTHVAITHFHPDHYEDLPALIYAMKYGTEPARAAPLTLLGPAGFRKKMKALASAFGEWVTVPGFDLGQAEFTPGTSLKLVPGVDIETHRTPHTAESVAIALKHGGARLVYTGDTGPSDELADWARGCDLLLAECSLPDDRAIAMHLTPRQAGALAARAQAKRLILTHLYPPVERVDILAQVQEAFGGSAVVATDGESFEC